MIEMKDAASNLEFTYNYYALSILLVPPQYAYPTMSVTVSNGPATFVSASTPALTCRFQVTTTRVASDFTECYSLLLIDTTTATTVGIIEWLNGYTQVATGVSVNQTTLPQISSLVSSATGPFAVYLDGSVTIQFDNTTGERTIRILQPQ